MFRRLTAYIEQDRVEADRLGGIQVPKPIIDKHNVPRLNAEPIGCQPIDLGRRLAQPEIAADEPVVDPALQTEPLPELQRPARDIIRKTGDTPIALLEMRQCLERAVDQAMPAR